MGVFPAANAAVGASIADRTAAVPAMVAMVHVLYSDSHFFVLSCHH